MDQRFLCCGIHRRDLNDELRGKKTETWYDKIERKRDKERKREEGKRNGTLIAEKQETDMGCDGTMRNEQRSEQNHV